VQALEHDSHIIPCTFDQVYFYKLGITLAKNENKSSIIYLGIGNMEGIRLLDEDNLQIYILSTRTFISSNEHELKKLRKVSYFTIQLDTDISTLDMITRNMAGNSLVISTFIEKDVIQFNNLMHYVKELTDLGVLTSLIGMRCHQPAVKYHEFHTIQPIKHENHCRTQEMIDFLKSQNISYSEIYFLMNESRQTCLGGFIVVKSLEILPGFDIKNMLPRHSQGNVFSVEHGNGNYQLDKTHGIGNDMLSWSQYCQDRYIDKLFKSKRKGLFVEIGGYDGELFSNTLFLEKEREWTGLLVEANPYTYNIMLKRNRKCNMINACISNNNYNITFIIAGGLTRQNEIITSKHRKRIDRDKRTYGKTDRWAHAGETVNIKCTSLLSIMSALNIYHIDYFSLDVEGAEMFILESIDWNRPAVDLLTIETHVNRDTILTLMTTHGYKWIAKLYEDDVFMKE
jgi:FkbM family methyltransferase